MAMRHIISAIHKADLDYGLIEDGDKICVGVSGGKDSMLLLYALRLYKDMIRRYDGRVIDVGGIHLDMGFGGMNFSDVDTLCRLKDIQLIHEKTDIYEILKLHPTDDNGSISCSLCSRLKKGALARASHKYGFSKVAYAHHADDAIETLFMNMIYGGRINTFDPAMHLTHNDTNFIRPLIYCFEKDIRNVVGQESIPVVRSTCPMDGYTSRQDIKEYLEETYRRFPEAQHNFLVSLSNTERTKLWVKGKDWKNV